MCTHVLIRASLLKSSKMGLIHKDKQNCFTASNEETRKRKFLIGRASDDTDKRHFGTFAIDNFNFWAVKQPNDRIREIG